MPLNPSDYDQALICTNGHVATSMLRRAPAHDAPYCENCGSPNISACPNCSEPIRGYYFGGGYSGEYPRPAYCVHCGEPFPWTVQAMEAGREILDDVEDLDPEERDRLKRALEDISREGPKTEAAAGRLRRFADRASGPVGHALLKAAAEVATEAARKILLGGPT